MSKQRLENTAGNEHKQAVWPFIQWNRSHVVFCSLSYVSSILKEQNVMASWCIFLFTTEQGEQHGASHLSAYPQFKWNNGCRSDTKLNMPWHAHRWTHITHLWGMVSMKQRVITICSTAHSLACCVSVYETCSCKQIRCLEEWGSRQQCLNACVWQVRSK